jgi:iron(III) transport system ATP-binding protein
MTGSAGLELVDVHHAYDGTPVVRDFTLSVAAGELVCLLGPSGCGKTTILRLIAGLEPLQRGRIAVAGRVVGEPGRDLPPEDRGVGFVFQDVALFPHLDIAGNVGFGLRGLAAGEKRTRVRAMLGRVHLDGYTAAWPHQLSGGQQQRVALARALAPAPRAILLDEPFSGLDTRLRAVVRDEALHLLKSDGVTTVIVTHDPEEAMFMADRIAVMREGRLEQIGAPAEIYTQPASEFVAEFMGEVNRIHGVVRGKSVATPFGQMPVNGHPDGTAMHVLVRPEALKVEGTGPSPDATRAAEAVPARVLASRLLGRTSWIHVCLASDPAHRHDAPGGCEAQDHWHVRVPGQFLPAEGTELRLGLDPRQVFVFAAPAPT